MQARFLLGPAGSGKTFRCLTEIRAELLRAPAGPPLLLLAPKQATFQLEQQLLASGEISGYSRLQVLSFDKLAGFILEQLAVAPAGGYLDDEGRIMVLRALLARHQAELRTFRASARLPGFARQLSVVLRELQRHQVAAARLTSLSAKEQLPRALQDKLHDLAILTGAYHDWLKTHQLQDGDSSLSQAARTLAEHPELSLAGLWLDGFAEMTPQELDLLAALLPRCRQATLAFCLDGVPREDVSWLSTWSAVAQSFRQCHQRLSELEGVQIETEILTRHPPRSRFHSAPALAHLEQHWQQPQAYQGNANVADTIQILRCVNAEAEAVTAARTIRRHVREQGGRYRDCAVLMRSLDGFHDAIRRVFTRYEIPFFLDQREPVAHHPLAELTRYALRTVTYRWRHDDWFGALKTGLVGVEDTDLDELENAALEHGWEGDAWFKPLVLNGHPNLTEALNALRTDLLVPFERLKDRLSGAEPTGAQLADALRVFWAELEVSQQLEDWSSAAARATLGPGEEARAAAHLTVWRQMQAWVDNVERAFATEAMPLRDWLPVLEAGLAGLTVGTVPPALDQVLVGAIDRSRNPDLTLAVVLGLNETVFPAPPEQPMLLTDAERQELEGQGVPLGLSLKQQLGQERFFAYIACTRPSTRLVLTYSLLNHSEKPLNPSPFLAHLQRLFPQLTVTDASAHPAANEAEHPHELLVPLLEAESRKEQAPEALAALPAFATPLARMRELQANGKQERLAPDVVERLYGDKLRVSPAALEDFAACPFKFFVARGLRARERKQLELDHRERGNLQHEILKEFQNRLQAEGRKWRELKPAEASALAGRIGEELVPTFQHGVFNKDDAGRFTARQLIEGVQRLLEVLVGWAPQYQFDPHSVELSFGFEQGLPGWEIGVDDRHSLWLRGRIDRVDLLPAPDGSGTLAVVMDYKSRNKMFESAKLEHGMQLQLLAYLGLLRHLADPRQPFAAEKLIPAGVFYVGMKAGRGSSSSRAGAAAESAKKRLEGYKHRGRFNLEHLAQLDARGADAGDQFAYRRTKAGGFHGGDKDPLAPEDFVELLDRAETQIRRIGTDIFRGDIRVAPYRIGKETACDWCEYRAICRFDAWTMPYRVLREPPKPEAGE